MLQKVKRWLYRHYQNNFLIYFIIFFLFTLGVIAGAISIKIIGPEKNDDIMLFLNSLFKAINNNSLNNISILKQSLMDNYKAILIIWLSGIVYLGIIVSPAIMLFRGFALGFSVGFFVYEYGIKGFLFSILGIFPQNLIIIPGIISIASVSMAFSLGSVKKRKIRLKNNSRLPHIVDYSLTILAFSSIIFIGSIIEAYIAPIFLRFLTEYLN